MKTTMIHSVWTSSTVLAIAAAFAPGDVGTGAQCGCETRCHTSPVDIATVLLYSGARLRCIGRGVEDRRSQGAGRNPRSARHRAPAFRRPALGHAEK